MLNTGDRRTRAAISPLCLLAVTTAMAVGAAGTTLATTLQEAQESQPAEMDEGAKLLAASVEALAELEHFKAKLTLGGDGEGGFASLTPRGEGIVQIVASKPETSTGETTKSLMVRIDGEAASNGSNPLETFTLFASQDRLGWHDDEVKAVRVRGIDRRLPRDQSNAAMIMPPELIEETPFSAEFAAESREVLGRETVDGVLCDVILVTYSRGQDVPAGFGGTSRLKTNRAQWYIGVEDRLPRRVDRIAGSGELSLVITQWISEIDTQTVIDPASIDIEQTVPEGYQLNVFIEPAEETIAERKRESVEPSREQDPMDAATGARPSRRAPTFSLKDEEGNIINNDAIAGEVSVFYFWGTWCVPCRAYSPLISDMAAEFEDEGLDINVYGVAVRERDPQRAFDLATNNGYAHTVVIASDDAQRMRMPVARGFSVRVYPSVAVVDADGEIVHFGSSANAGDAQAVVDALNAAAREAAGNM